MLGRRARGLGAGLLRTEARVAGARLVRARLAGARVVGLLGAGMLGALRLGLFLGLLLGLRLGGGHRDVARLVEAREGRGLAEEVHRGDVLAHGDHAAGDDLADRERVAARRTLEEPLEREVRRLLLLGRLRCGQSLPLGGGRRLGTLRRRALLLATAAAALPLLGLAVRGGLLLTGVLVVALFVTAGVVLVAVLVGSGIGVGRRLGEGSLGSASTSGSSGEGAVVGSFGSTLSVMARKGFPPPWFRGRAA
ncbi:MAG: hypothetical protein M5U28_31850 [Sandaracinaceae bacterium]|nr:hypothetical protein [Sandaracinaceae bacterium]